MKVTRYILLLLLSTIALYFAVLLVLCNINYDHVPIIHYTNNYSVRMGGNTYYQFSEFDVNQKYDAVILGASKALKAYDVFKLKDEGINTFNLATHVQNPLNSYPIVQHLLNSSNCKHIYYEITDGLYSNPLMSSVQSDIDLITNTQGSVVAMDIIKRDLNPKYLNTYFIRTMQWNNEITPAENGYMGLGFVGIDETLNALNKKELIEGKNRPLADIVWNENAISELKKLIELIQSKQIKLTGVYGPVSSYYPKKRVKNHVAYMSEIFSSYGCEFWDLSQFSTLDDYRHFSDVNHLNKAGAQVFTDSLLVLIKQQH